MSVSIRLWNWKIGEKRKVKRDLYFNNYLLFIMALHFFILNLEDKAHRITGSQSTVILVQFTIYLIISLAFLVSAAYYLFLVEVDVPCFYE